MPASTALQALVAAMGAIVVQRAGVDHAAAREGQARLAFQPGNVFREAELQGMRAARDEGINQRHDVAGAHRTERDPAPRRRDFDHRL